MAPSGDDTLGQGTFGTWHILPSISVNNVIGGAGTLWFLFNYKQWCGITEELRPHWGRLPLVHGIYYPASAWLIQLRAYAMPSLPVPPIIRILLTCGFW